MLDRIVNYWLRPLTAEYETNWQIACYNRLWYLLAVVDVVLLLIVAPVFIAMKSAHLPVVGAVAIAIHIINIVQFLLQDVFFPETCKQLREGITSGKSK